MRENPDDHTRLVLLGTGGGPSWWPDGPANQVGRSGIASAVAVGDAVYLVDCGSGWGPQYVRAGLLDESSSLNSIRAVFLTHLHSDHVVDYPALLLYGWRDFEEPVSVFGPGDRGAAPPVCGPEPDQPLPVVSLHRPTPGTVAMTQALIEAFATDINVRIHDERAGDPREAIVAHDIALPPDVARDPNANPVPRMSPIAVYEDENVSVSATLVSHPPVFPAFGFRFDTAGGSVTFSGDTSPSANLIELASGSDILVHEVIDSHWAESLMPAPRSDQAESQLLHLLSSHTSMQQVGQVAEQAGVGTLVLNHFVPASHPASRWEEVKRHFSGRLIVGEDLQQIGVGELRRS